MLKLLGPQAELPGAVGTAEFPQEIPKELGFQAEFPAYHMMRS